MRELAMTFVLRAVLKGSSNLGKGPGHIILDTTRES